MKALRVGIIGTGLITAAIAIAATFAACTIDRRSDAYACQSSPDCDNGRVCIDQLCVVPSDGGSDPSGCPAGCTRCDNGTCFLDCLTRNCPNFQCPQGWKCNIACGQRRCSNIDCGTSDCQITCTGLNACEDVSCGPGRCTVMCDGRNACENFDCSTSCACQLTCTSGLDCFGGNLSCPTGCTVGAAVGCDGATPACNTCQ